MIEPHRLPLGESPTAAHGWRFFSSSSFQAVSDQQHPLLEGLPEWKNTWVQMSQENGPSAHEEGGLGIGELVGDTSMKLTSVKISRMKPWWTGHGTTQIQHQCVQCLVLSNPLVSFGSGLGIRLAMAIPRSCKVSKWSDFSLLIFGRSTSWIVTWPAALLVFGFNIYIRYV